LALVHWVEVIILPVAFQAQTKLQKGRALTNIVRDLSLAEFAFVRSNDLASAFVLFARTEPACVFCIHEQIGRSTTH